MAELTWHGKTSNQKNIPADSSNSRFTTVEIFTRMPGTGQVGNHTPPATVWQNRLIHSDALQSLPVLLTEFQEAIDLIYIDPPFMTGRDFKNGGQLAYSDKWNHSMDDYLVWLYEVFRELHGLLARDGSLYVHLDWRAAHYARVLLDEVFGNSSGAGFINEIIWHYQSGGRASRHFARKHDTILLYAKTGEYCFHPERISERRGTQKRNHMRKAIDEQGEVHWTIKSAGRIYSYSEHALMTPSDVWSDINHLHQRDPERLGYATQKPLALLERILLASTEEGDLVFDCFCGSGVTPYAAQQLGRRWIAIDQSELAIAKARERLLAHERVYPFVLQRLEGLPT